MPLQNRVPPAAATPDVNKMSVEDRIKFVVVRAASRLPASVGRQLLTLIEPKSLAVMAGVLAAWTGAQFFGVGEVADILVLVGGYVMFGATALQAARLLFDSGRLMVRAKDQPDLDAASAKLAEAVTLIGVQGVLAILLDKPGDAMKKQFFATDRNPTPFAMETFKGLPVNRWWGYSPTTEGVIDPEMDAGVGGTSVRTGDITYSLKGSDTDRRLALAHEKVHQFLTPKLRVFRRVRTFLRAQGYNRSYLLRYLEEAIAETTAQIRVKGLAKANLIEGIRFPLGDDYMVTVGDIKGESRQIFLGPIMIGGMTYQVWAARRSRIAKGPKR